MLLAESLPSENTATTMGMVVIIGIQLASFIFAWRKDSRGSEAAKKEDLKTLKTELQQEIRQTDEDLKTQKAESERKLEAHKADMDRKFEAHRLESDRSRSALHEKINDVSHKTAAVLKGQEVMEQTLTSLGNKLDAVRHKLSN